jgi:hypothetical protein
MFWYEKAAAQHVEDAREMLNNCMEIALLDDYEDLDEGSDSSGDDDGFSDEVSLIVLTNPSHHPHKVLIFLLGSGDAGEGAPGRDDRRRPRKVG